MELLFYKLSCKVCLDVVLMQWNQETVNFHIQAESMILDWLFTMGLLPEAVLGGFLRFLEP